jgi:hypothetical protein
VGAGIRLRREIPSGRNKPSLEIRERLVAAQIPVQPLLNLLV